MNFGLYFLVCRSESSHGRIECVEECDHAEARAQPGLEQYDHPPGQHRCSRRADRSEEIDSQDSTLDN